ncbi:MAG TPA: hypothetical protein ENO25_01830, partial [Desulfobacteraceae bacterium]|nr:hypothetical protein [Desulfobacteraceae bacterium]
MAFRRLRSFLFLTLLLFLLLAGSVLLAHSLIQRPSVQEYLLNQLSEAVGYDIRANRMQLLLWKGVGIRAHDVEIGPPEGPKIFAASRVIITLSLQKLVRGRIVPTGLTLEGPQIDLAMPDSWEFTPSGDSAFPGDALLEAWVAFPYVTLEQARVTVKGMPLQTRALFIRLSRKSKSPVAFDVKLNGIILYDGEPVSLFAEGTVTADNTVGMSARITLKATGIPLS